MSEYGLELGKSYNSEEVLSLLLIAEEEAKASIKNAYAEGYKAGLLEYASENARLESINSALQKDLQSMQIQINARQQITKYAPVIFATVAFASFVGGYSVRGIIWK